ncbi:MAG: hypothetical protein U1A27_08735 [Phycisphaerae bacterium]
MRLSRVSIGTGVLVAGSTAAFVFGLALPGQRRLAAQRIRIASQQRAVEGEQLQARHLAEVYSDVQSRGTRERAARAAVPGTHGFAESFKSVSAMLGSSGLTRRSVQPGRIVAWHGPAGAEPDAAAADVMVQPIVIDAEGPAAGVQAFVAALETWPRLNTLESLVLSVESQPRGLSGQGPALRCQAVVHTYFRIPRGERDGATLALAPAAAPRPQE